MLLLYLADELPAVDRSQVEKRLGGDEPLRAKLEQLRADQQMIAHAFQAIDAAQPLPGGNSAAQERKLNRAITRWHTERILSYAGADSGQTSRSRWWWAYPLAAAAVLLVSFIVWWGTHTEDAEPSTPGTNWADQRPWDPSRMGEWRRYATPIDIVEDTPGLASAEKELETVAYLRTLTE